MNQWYKQIEAVEILQQGDFLYNCPIAKPSDSKNWDTIDIENYDVIIMSQSCDLKNNKIDLVLVCPYYTLSEFTDINKSFSDYKLRESARQGNLPGYHLLNSCSFLNHEEILIVDFKTIFSLSFEFLNTHKLEQEKRISLSSPYKEHLSQAFARFFMRVGLPSGIPKFVKK